MRTYLWFPPQTLWLPPLRISVCTGTTIYCWIGEQCGEQQCFPALRKKVPSDVATQDSSCNCVHLCVHVKFMLASHVLNMPTIRGYWLVRCIVSTCVHSSHFTSTTDQFLFAFAVPDEAPVRSCEFAGGPDDWWHERNHGIFRSRGVYLNGWSMNDGFKIFSRVDDNSCCAITLAMQFQVCLFRKYTCLVTWQKRGRILVRACWCVLVLKVRVSQIGTGDSWIICRINDAQYWKTWWWANGCKWWMMINVTQPLVVIQMLTTPWTMGCPGNDIEPLVSVPSVFLPVSHQEQHGLSNTGCYVSSLSCADPLAAG